MHFGKRHIAACLSLCICLVGCIAHIKPDKFEIHPESMQRFSSNVPIRVVVPQNAEKEYLVERPNSSLPKLIAVDLNDLYKNVGELMEEVLAQNKVPVSADAPKYLKFTINNVQMEPWAVGFVRGAYLDFDIGTSDGYIQQYKVQDGSGANVSRAIGGTVSRAVEIIFQDREVINFIESR